MHSCSTFQNKIWICAPFVRGNRNTMRKCWKFDGESIEEGPGLKNGHYSSTIAKISVDGEVWVRIFNTNYIAKKFHGKLLKRTRFGNSWRSKATNSLS